MHKKAVTEKMIIEAPTSQCVIYAIINPIEKKVYIGETCDSFRRFSEHMRGIGFRDKEMGTNENLANENCRTYHFMTLYSKKYDKHTRESKKEINEWMLYETIYMYLFKKRGFILYNGDNRKQDNLGKKRSFLLGNEIISETFLKEKWIVFSGQRQNIRMLRLKNFGIKFTSVLLTSTKCSNSDMILHLKNS